jgi:LEA14-like dessication related protein
MKSIYLVFLICFTSCAQLTQSLLKDPEVKFLNTEVAKVTAEDISLNIKLNISNPNAVPLNVGKIKYQFSFSESSVTEGVFDKGINVPATGNSDVVVPLTVKFNSIGNLIQKFLKKTVTEDYQIKGTVDLGFISIPFSKQGKIDIKK